MRPGHVPHQIELIAWERQMRECRRIYRTQYLQKLAEVTTVEREKQMTLYKQERDERRRRKGEILERAFEDRKRRAILKDQKRIEGKVNEAVEMTRRYRTQQRKIKWLSGMEEKNTYLTELEAEKALIDKEMKLFTRNVSAPEILKQLGKNPEVVRSIKRKIIGADNVFRTLMEESFAILPEDDPQYEPESARLRSGSLTARQRAHVMYSGFNEDEKLNLLNQKIEMLKEALDKEHMLKGASKDLLSSQLLDQLEAAKAAYLERREAEKARAEAAFSRGEVKGEDASER